eukprot:254159_1
MLTTKKRRKLNNGNAIDITYNKSYRISQQSFSKYSIETTSAKDNTGKIITGNAFLKLLRKKPKKVLFVDKYKPQRSSDLFGNNESIQKLKQFLLRWDKIKNCNGVKKGVLLSGPPGIGKTLAVHVIAKELLFNIIEMNASDTRSKESLKNAVEQSLDNHRISDFFASQNTNKNKNKNIKNIEKKKKKIRNLIIMDEIDGMSSSDQGGIGELISYIRTSKIPIIFICNDRYTSKIHTLAKYCIDLEFGKPISYQIQNKLDKIVTNEFPRDSKDDYLMHNKIVEGTIENGCGDIRQMLHLLQLWSNDGKNTHNRMLYQKDLTMGPWDILSKLFNTQEELNISKYSEYDVDYSLISLL